MLHKLRKSQKLRFYVRAANEQPYRPSSLGSTAAVSKERIELSQLGDAYINELVERALRRRQRSRVTPNVVLEEGILDASTYRLGQIVVNVQYSFQDGKPLIEIPGKYDHISRTFIWVKLLDASERDRLERDVLHPVYHGKTYIWPGDVKLLGPQILEKPI